MQPVLLAGAANAAGGTGGASTPLDYGSNLKLFLLADSDVTESSNNVSAWADQVGPLSFTVPSGQKQPLFQSATQNGLDGVSFEEDVGQSGAIRRKLSNAANAVDNFFTGGTDKSLAFAARIDALSNSFGTNFTLASKGFSDSTGWILSVTTAGTMRFRHKRSDGSNWQLDAAGIFSAGSLVLGRIVYNGGNASGSGSFRLYNGSAFVTTGTVTVGSGSTSTGTESTRDLLIGNLLDTADNNQNAPFEGPIFAIWMTSPASTSLDEAYLARWIP